MKLTASLTALEGVKHVVAVGSGKGGVGKSTTAANLAVALAQHLHQRTGLLDADVHGPSIPRLMGIEGIRPGVSQDANARRLLPVQNFGVKCMSTGLLMPGSSAAVWRGPMVMAALDQMLRQTAWAPLDVLVVDLPPGTGDAQLTLAQKCALAGAVLVSTPQDVALIDVRRAADMFAKVGVPILGVVENMSGFVCPHCQEETAVFGSGGAASFARELGAPLLAQIPLQMDIRTSSDEGKPIVISHPSSLAAQRYKHLAQYVLDTLLQLPTDTAATKKGEKMQGGPEIVMSS